MVVHRQFLELDDAGFGLLADDARVEPVAFAAVVAGFDDLGIARGVAGIGRGRVRGIGVDRRAVPLTPMK